jgi:hypothetical protein
MDHHASANFTTTDDLVELRHFHSTLDLNAKCKICLENLGRCLQIAESAAQIDYAFIRTKIRQVKRTIQERKLRLAIWIHDCGIENDDLSALRKDKDASLIAALGHLFSTISNEEEHIFRSLCDLKSIAVQAAQDDSNVFTHSMPQSLST